jgi:rhamnulokinase
MIAGLQQCARLANEIAAIGIDGWAVDYVRLNAAGEALANPYCYRDERTIEAVERVHRKICPETLYRLTGIQFLRFNTLYQLYADRADGFDQSLRWINLPEFFTHQLGGEPVAEYTNATHTGLVSLSTNRWCEQIFGAVGLDMAAAPTIVPTGTIVGRLRGPLAGLPGFRQTQLIVPACHDTASAIAGIPAEGDDWAFISSGTWSLVGTLLDSPCATEEARQKNYTNLGGAGGKICFLKNVNAMWLLRQCIEHWGSNGHRWTISELIDAAEKEPAPDYLVDLDDPDLLLPGNMPARINAQRKRAGLPPLPDRGDGAPGFAATIFHSLAARYAQVLWDI